MIPPDIIPGHFDIIACSSTLSHQEMNHTSMLFFVCLHFQCSTNTLYTRLTSRAIKKQLCGPVRFHYACLIPYIWQYRYVTTVLPAFARDVFYVFSFHLTAHYSNLLHRTRLSLQFTSDMTQFSKRTGGNKLENYCMSIIPELPDLIPGFILKNFLCTQSLEIIQLDGPGYISMPSIHPARNPKHVIVQWIDIGTHIYVLLACILSHC